jgi:hypothetical protein
MRGDKLFAQALGKMARNALGVAAGVDEDQRRRVFVHQRGELIVELLPYFVRHHRLQRRRRHHDL